MSIPNKKELDLLIYLEYIPPILHSKRIHCDAELVCKAQLEKDSNHNSIKEISLARFKLRDIPNVMKAKGWLVGGKLQNAWFEGNAYILSNDAKRGKEGADLSEELIANAVESDFVDWDWLMSFDLVRKKFAQLTMKNKEIYGFSIEHNLNNNIYSFKAKQEFINRFINDKEPKPRSNNNYLSGMEILKGWANKRYLFDKEAKNIYFYHRYWQFQFIKIGDSLFEKPKNEDDIEDWFAAFGSFTLNVAPYEIFIKEIENNKFIVELTKIAVYSRDSFDFNGEQYLGFWNKNGVLLPNEESFKQAIYLGLSKIGFKDIESEPNYAIDKPILKDGVIRELYFPVSNRDYNAWRENSIKKGEMKGRDMLVFSNINIVDISSFFVTIMV